MDRTLNRLKAGKIDKLGEGLHADGGGLYLSVKGSTARSWIFRYRRNGRLRDHGLGPVHTVSLPLARQLALKCRVALLEGRDPIDARRAGLAGARKAPRAMTFKDAAEKYIAAHRAGWRDGRNEHQWQQSLTDYAFPVFGDYPVSLIDTELVMRAIGPPLWATKTETMSRVRGRIEAILDWAKSSGHRQGENPARWRGHLENLLPRKSKVKAVAHMSALPYGELAGFIAGLREQEGITARALEFMILTVARPGKEVSAAKWGEINPSERLWTIPAERMKAGKEHRVPLSEAALGVLEQMQRVGVNEFVFPGERTGKPIGHTAMMALLRRLRSGVTVHGFRSTFSDWVAEKTDFPSEVREMALAHAVGDKVEAAYRRGDLFEKRRRIMAAWADYCGSGPVPVLEIAARRVARG
jgi:integrase